MTKLFFKPVNSFTLTQILEHIGYNKNTLSNVDTDSIVIKATSDLAMAELGHISFISTIKFKKDADMTNASVVFATEKTKDLFSDKTVVIIVDDPHLSYAIVKQLFYPRPSSTGTISMTAIVDATATIGVNSEIRSGAVIGADVLLGEGVIIGENVVIGKNVVIDSDSIIGANTVIEYATLGSNCQIHANVTIGSRGFGFIPNPEAHIDIVQTGGVVIGENVEIGAGSCVDRGAEKDTVICDNCRLDNLVHIAHNAYIGKGSILAGQCGFAGSVTVGEGVMFGGQCGVSTGVSIGDKSIIMGRSGVARDVPSNEVYAGFPARPYRQWLKESKDK